jgi:hypothetical protein
MKILSGIRECRILYVLHTARHLDIFCHNIKGNTDTVFSSEYKMLTAN